MAGFSLLSAAARRLEGKVALITGGASGIGESTARLFSKHGAKVVIADVQDGLGRPLAKQLNLSSTTFVHCDVTNENDVAKAVDTATAKYGKLDIMFNNAGILGMVKPSIVDEDTSEFENILRVNMVGVFLGTKHAARVMMAARTRGVIINSTASVCAVTGYGAPHGYPSSKHGVVGLTKNTSLELGQYGIRVNCVSPYYVPTPMVKGLVEDADGRVSEMVSNLKGVTLTAEDVAEAVLYLGSEEARYVSGHNLVIDGGFSCGNRTPL